LKTGKSKKQRNITNIIKPSNDVKDDYIVFDRSIFPKVIKLEKNTINKELDDYKSYSDFLNNDMLKDKINKFSAPAINTAYGLLNTISYASIDPYETIYNELDNIAEQIKNLTMSTNETLNDYRTFGNFLSYRRENRFPINDMNNLNDFRAYGNYINANKDVINDYKNFGNFIGDSLKITSKKKSYVDNDIPSSYN